MKLERDFLLFLAVLMAVTMPVLPLTGNPTNLAAIALLVALTRQGAERARLRCLYLVALIIFLGSLSTAAAAVTAIGSYSLNPNSFGPFFRMAICGCAIASANRPAQLHSRLLWIGCAGSLFSILQYFSPAVTEFTSIHYLAAERSSVFTEDFSGDSIVRVVGVYENPSSVALMALCLILATVHSYANGRLSRVILMLFVVINFVAGMLSLSKIFFAGLPIIFLQLLMLRFRKAAVLSLSAAILLAWVVYSLEDPLIDVVRYALESALNPDSALKGRYLAEQEKVVAQSWIFGHGIADVQHVIINDSAYLVIFYLIGLFGATALGLHVVWWMRSGGRHVPLTLLLMITVVLLAGVGANSILGFRVDIIMTALAVSMYMDSRRKKSERKRTTYAPPVC
jgi:hypothetical protein